MTEQITLASGCFWCTEAVFQTIRGVESAVSGYIGGTVQNPTYDQVCTGKTGHAEAVQITFDPEIIPLADILRVFFGSHNPTTLNRQGADAGTQYRSAIFYGSADQKAAAEAIIAELTQDGVWEDPIVTTLEPLTDWYSAEDYHQEYAERNSGAMYCQLVIDPKLKAVRAKYQHLQKQV